MPGVLKFEGFATGDGIEGVGSGDSKKVFPDGVYHFLIEGWHDSLLNSSSDEELMAFLEAKGAADVHKEFVSDIKKKGGAMMANMLTGFYSSSKIKPLLKAKYAAAYEEKGINAVISKVTVNLGQPAHREFLWMELIDIAAAPDYSTGNCALSLDTVSGKLSSRKESSKKESS